MIPQRLYKRIEAIGLNTPEKMAALEIQRLYVSYSRHEYHKKEAFRVHLCDDNNKICLCGGVVALLNKHKNISICMTSGLRVIYRNIQQNEWSERYVIYEHIMSLKQK